jgi:DNA-binding IclR family transcriptional regulator
VEDSELDDKLHQMLRELRRALSEAISDSAEVNRTLRKIREEGYALYLLVDCKRESLDEESLSLTAPSFCSGSEPVFQIDGRDLNFLRSIGIDPTRRLRRRRTTAT